jgi:hypothetical protein
MHTAYAYASKCVGVLLLSHGDAPPQQKRNGILLEVTAAILNYALASFA